VYTSLANSTLDPDVVPEEPEAVPEPLPLPVESLDEQPLTKESEAKDATRVNRHLVRYIR
jgi:hypothetical protein